jgi:KTSC domain
LQAHHVLRQVVESSSLRSLGYDRATRTLEVEFKHGGVYRYEEVPPELWSELRLAESKGQFFQERVRDHFATTRLG